MVATLGAGDHFGELALLHDAPRSATVRTRTPVRLFRLEPEAFRTLLSAAFTRQTRAEATSGYGVSGAH